MPQRDSEYLFDITTRLALFVEGIKLWQVQEFNSTLRAVDEELRRLLGRIQYKTLDGLTKAELNTLLLALRKSQLRIYGAYTHKLITTLEAFMQVRKEVTGVAYASAKRAIVETPQDQPLDVAQLTETKAFAFIEQQSERESFAPLYGLAAITGRSSALWATIRNAPIPANGLYLVAFIQGFAKSAQASVENTVRKGYANKLTVAEVLNELNGPASKQGNSTQFAKIRLQAASVIDTSFAHVDQIVSQAIASALYSHYGWVSIIDGSTTTICRERNHKAYRYGAGPIPPAHYRCRSVTVPLASLFDSIHTPTLYAWLKAQSKDVRREFLGKEAAALFDADKITAKDFASLQVGKALNLNQFKSKLGLILST